MCVPLLSERGLSWLLLLCDSDSEVWELSSSPELDWQSSELSSSSELHDSSENWLLFNKVAFCESKNIEISIRFPTVSYWSADSYVIDNFGSEHCWAAWSYGEMVTHMFLPLCVWQRQVSLCSCIWEMCTACRRGMRMGGRSLEEEDWTFSLAVSKCTIGFRRVENVPCLLSWFWANILYATVIVQTQSYNHKLKL